MLANLLAPDKAVTIANAVRTTGATTGAMTAHARQRWLQRRSQKTNNVNMHVLHVLVSASALTSVESLRTLQW